MYSTINQTNQKTTTLALPLEDDFSNKIDILFWIPLILGAFAYFLLSVNYNIFYGDDAWTISNVWNITQLGIAQDLVFIEPDGEGYYQYFGISYSYVMGNMLDLLGWTKTNVFVVNSIFIWLAAFTWWRIIQHLPFSKSIANLMLVFIPLFPPFFFAAHVGRPDAFVVLIIAIQLLMFIRKRYFLAALLTGVTLETHVMGVVGLFFMLAYFIYEHKDLLLDGQHFKSIFFRFSIGGIAAIGFYISLHYDHFSFTELSAMVQNKKDMVSPVNNYILAYFIDFDWMSHVWEFALMITAGTLFIKKGLHKKNRFLTILLLVLIISTLITRRENRNYLVYIFPAFMLLYFYTFEQMGKLKTFTKGLTIMLGLYFATFYFLNNDYDFERMTMEVEATIQDENVPVLGIADFWFAAKEKEFIPIHFYRDLGGLDMEEFYFIQSDFLGDRIRIYDDIKSYYLKNYDSELVNTIVVRDGDELKIWKCSKNGREIPTMEAQHIPSWKEDVRKYFKESFLGNKQSESKEVEEI